MRDIQTSTQGKVEEATLRGRILDAARELFYTHGYSKVSTTEIAQAISISKKTLYKEFESKEEILRAVILPKLRRGAEEVDSVLSNTSLSYIEKLRIVMSTISNQHRRVSPIMMKDIYVHAPEIWEEINSFRKNRFKKAEQLLLEGVSKGIFRSDIKPEIMIQLYTSSIENFMTPRMLEELPCTSQEVFESLMKILIEGVLKEEYRDEYRREETRSNTK